MLAPPALAKAGAPTVAPAKPLATDALTITARIPAGPAGGRYALSVTTHAGGACQSFAVLRPVGTAGAGDRISVELVPRTDGAWTGWCSGKAVAALLRRDARGGWVPVPGARRAFRITRTPKVDPHVLFGTKVLIDVLPTSTATVTLPGHADRALGLGGTIDAFIPGKFVLNRDYLLNLRSSAMAVTSLVTDPVCASGTIHTGLPFAVGTPSALGFDSAGGVAGTLTLAADPLSLAGCAGPATGTTTLELSGKLDALKLADTTLTAKTFYVPVGGGGGNATVNVVLHLKINILD
jgi:hypothetical protein